MRMLRTRCLATATLLLALGVEASTAQTGGKRPLTFDWVYGDSGSRLNVLPSTTWLSDGTLLYYDRRLPAEQRAFEIIDPATGARRTSPISKRKLKHV